MSRRRDVVSVEGQSIEGRRASLLGVVIRTDVVRFSGTFRT